MSRVLSLSNLGIALVGGLALLVLSPAGHMLGLLALISVIGIPVYFLLLAIPTLFLLLVVLRLASEAWQGFRSGNRGKALLCALALLAMADFFILRAWRVNGWLEGRAAALAAADQDRLGPAQPIATLAVLRNTRQSKDDANPCDDLCQRLLLTGAATQVLELTAVPEPRPNRKGDPILRSPEWPALEFTQSMTGTAWRLEQRAACPEIEDSGSLRPISVPRPPRPPGARYVPEHKPAELMRLKIAGGTCLVGEAMTLAGADAVLAYGHIRSGTSDYRAGFDAWADTLSAWRIAFWRKSEGSLVEQYRHTGVAWTRPPGVFIPFIVNGYQFETSNGWLRQTRRLNRSRYEHEPPLADFVIQRLGLDLVPRIGSAPGEDTEASPQAALVAEQGKAVDRILSAGEAPTAPDAKLLSDYLGNLGSAIPRNAVVVGKDDARRVLRIVEERRFGMSWRTAGAVRQVIRLDAPVAAELAAALVARLGSLPPPTSENRARGSWNDEIRAITGSLAELPAEAVRPYQMQTVALMHDRDRRMAATHYLGHLDVFGASIAPDVFAMMDDAASLRGARGKEAALGRSWSDVWRAGAYSICRLAPAISSSLDDMRRRANTLALQKLHIADNVVAAAMLRMGAEKDDIRATLDFDPLDEKAMRNFASLMRRAERDQACR